MAEVVNVETAHEAVNSAVTEAELATHEALDQTAHDQITEAVDEDYAWLTERLDATNREVVAIREQLLNQFELRIADVLIAFQESREAQAQLIATQADMIRTLSETVTRQNESVLLRLNPPNSPNESETTEEVQVTETEPERATASESTHEEPERASGKRKLRRI